MEQEEKATGALNRFIDTVDRILVWVCTIFGGLVLAGLTLLTAFNVLVMRKALNAPIIGAEDVMVLLLITIVTLSVALGARTGAHIEIEVLESQMSQGFAKWSYVFVKCLGVVILGILSWQLVHAGGSAARFGETTQLLLISYGPFYYLLAAAIAFYVVVLVLDILQLVQTGVVRRLEIGGELK